MAPSTRSLISELASRSPSRFHRHAASSHQQRAVPAGKHRAVHQPPNPLTLTDYDGFSQVNHLPYSEEWNFGVQWEVTRGIIVEVNYVGSHGVHLAINLPTNTISYNPALDTLLSQENSTLTTQQAWPFPNIGSFNSLNMEGVGTYNALQTSVRKQTGQNLVFVANYTW